jgi:glycyl-tRNA synthetase beta subunit
MAGGFDEFVDKFRSEQKSDTFTARTVGAAAVSEAMAGGITKKLAGKSDVQSTTASNIANEVSQLSARLKDATDGEEVKGIVNEMKSLKRVVDSFDKSALSEDGREDINKL